MLTRIKDTHLIYILILFITVGAIGLMTPYHKVFEGLSFYNLLLNFLLLAISLKSNLSRFNLIIAILFLIGFVAEIIGVQTSLLFGNYYYLTNLGPKIYGVPLIIGINWAILSIGAWVIISEFFEHRVLRIILASFLMVFFDLLMEPVAIKLNFWKWENGIIPLYNFACWFIISLIQMIVLSVFKVQKAGIAKWVFTIQILFFIWLNFWFYIS